MNYNKPHPPNNIHRVLNTAKTIKVLKVVFRLHCHYINRSLDMLIALKQYKI